MTKYYAGYTRERSGEYEFSVLHFFEITGRQKPETRMKHIAKTWYAGTPSKDGDEWVFNNEIWMSAGNCKEITKATYDELSSFY